MIVLNEILYWYLIIISFATTILLCFCIFLIKTNIKLKDENEQLKMDNPSEYYA